MTASQVQFPGPGCVVEFMQGNKPVQAWVLETQAGSVRLLSEGRRESKLSVSRLLPWLGPLYSGQRGKQEMADLLEHHRIRREELAASIAMDEVWELAQGEVEKARVTWLAELVWEAPDIDQIAAMGHAALACKTRFRFAPPDFEIYDAEKVALREAEQAATEKREAFVVTGGEFFRELRALHEGRRGPLTAREFPPEELGAKLAAILRSRIADPEQHDAEGAWKLLTKSLPDEPFLALHLARAWGLVPRHHNYLMDQAGYDGSRGWVEEYADDVAAVRDALAQEEPADSDHTEKAPDGEQFYSIDAASTRDVDDAFFVRRNDDGTFHLSLAFACPALVWPFGSGLDKAVMRRATSLYLPEGDFHMIPEEAGLALFGLSPEAPRPVLRVDAVLDAKGTTRSLEPRMDWIQLSERLTFEGVQSVLAPGSTSLSSASSPASPAAPPAAFLHDAFALASLLRHRRLEQGAVITDRIDPVFRLEKDGNDEIRVAIEPGPEAFEANLLVSELMIFSNHALAVWAQERGIPLFHRTQDVALPKEYAGVWTEVQDVTRVVKHLPPASLEVSPRPHAGLGLKLYATLTSPLRRYTDLVNEGQIVHYLRHGSPLFTEESMNELLPVLSARLEQSGKVQRFRPRYWKLLFYQQAGDKAWWEAVVSEENDHFVTLSLPLAQIFVRVKRKTLGDKIYGGQRFRVRLGKINPLLGEIQVLAAQEE